MFQRITINSNTAENYEKKKTLATMIHPDFPQPVRIEIEKALETNITCVQRPRSGMWEHTYLISNETYRWVVRLHKAPAPKLKRALTIQQKAESVGMRVPKIVAYRLEALEENYVWMVEEYVHGSEFYCEFHLM